MIQAALIAEADEFLGRIAGVPPPRAQAATVTAMKSSERSPTAARR